MPTRKKKPTHGGAREGAGRPARGAAAADHRITIRLTEGEMNLALAGLRVDDDETVAGLFREAGLRELARRLHR